MARQRSIAHAFSGARIVPCHDFTQEAWPRRCVRAEVADDSSTCHERIKVSSNIFLCLFVSLLIITMIEVSLEVKLPTIWTDEKQKWEESEKRREENRREEKRRDEKRREEKKKEDQKRESLRRKKIQARKKVGSRDTPCVSNDLWLRRVEA